MNFRRPPGTRVTYTRFQDARYLSPRARMDRALRLQLTFISDSGGVITWHSLSARSPRGHWTVTARRNPAGAPDPGSGGVSFSGGQCNAVYTVTIAFQRHYSYLSDSVTPQREFHIIDSFTQMEGIIGPISEVYLFTPEEAQALSGAEGRSSFGMRVIAAGRLFHPSPNSQNVYTRVNGVGHPSNPRLDYSVDISEFSNPVYTVELRDGSPDNCGNYGGGGGNSGGSGGSSSPYLFECDCPDQTKQVGGLPWAIYPSEAIARDWSNSRAGAQSPCKHILRAAIALGQYQLLNPVGIPDLTLVDPYQEWRDRQRRQRDAQRAQNAQARADRRYYNEMRRQQGAAAQARFRHQRTMGRLDYYRRQTLFTDRRTGEVRGYGRLAQGPDAIARQLELGQRRAQSNYSERYGSGGRVMRPSELYGQIWRDFRGD